MQPDPFGIGCHGDHAGVGGYPPPAGPGAPRLESQLTEREWIIIIWLAAVTFIIAFLGERINRHIENHRVIEVNETDDIESRPHKHNYEYRPYDDEWNDELKRWEHLEQCVAPVDMFPMEPCDQVYRKVPFDLDEYGIYHGRNQYGRVIRK